MSTLECTMVQSTAIRNYDPPFRHLKNSKICIPPEISNVTQQFCFAYTKKGHSDLVVITPKEVIQRSKTDQCHSLLCKLLANLLNISIPNILS